MSPESRTTSLLRVTRFLMAGGAIRLTACPLGATSWMPCSSLPRSVKRSLVIDDALRLDLPSPRLLGDGDRLSTIGSSLVPSGYSQRLSFFGFLGTGSSRTWAGGPDTVTRGPALVRRRGNVHAGGPGPVMPLAAPRRQKAYGILLMLLARMLRRGLDVRTPSGLDGRNLADNVLLDVAGGDAHEDLRYDLSGTQLTTDVISADFDAAVAGLHLEDCDELIGHLEGICSVHRVSGKRGGERAQRMEISPCSVPAALLDAVGGAV